MNKITIRNIVLLWLAWVLIMIGFQALATTRFQPQWPDMLIWFEGDPTDVINYRQLGHPYLLEPFMNNQVLWDSEVYIGVSIDGYDDPCLPVAYESIAALGGVVVPCTDTINTDTIKRTNEKPIPLSYAFFPFYPILIHLFSIPLSLLDLNPIATATLAGVIVSALGILAAMLALYDLTHEALGEEGGMRAVFYLLIFPTSFYFVQVYTEGLFVGLAFGCLAMLKRRRLLVAALLAAAATLTRAVGVTSVIPMAISWIRTKDWYGLDVEWDRLYFKRPPWRPIWHALLAFTPLIVYLVWKFSYYGAMFDYVETAYFYRAPLDLGRGFGFWSEYIYAAVVGHDRIHTGFIVSSAFRVDYLLEACFSALGFATILRGLKTDPELAWFSLAAFLIAWVSGPPGIQRYMLVAPALFVTLARWGRNSVFDRVWTIASLLLMGLLATLYAFNFWVG